MSLFVMSPCYCPTAEPAAGMMATANRVGLRPHLYGVGKTIATNCSNAQGVDMLELIASRTEDYILCVDCMDIAFLAGEEEIMEKFHSMNSGLVVSAEQDGIEGVRKTKVRLHQMCIAEGGYHPQLNIGAYIGERKYALHCFTEAERIWRDRPEDPNYNYDCLPQWMMMMKAWGEGPDFTLDTKDVLFQSMNKADTSMEGKRVRNNVTGTLPVLLHYNGDKSRVAYHEMVERLLA